MRSRLFLGVSVVSALSVAFPLAVPLTAQPGPPPPSPTLLSPGLVTHHSPHHDLVPQAGPRRGRGALWGAGIGLVAGGLLGGLTADSDEGDDGVGGSLVEASATGEAVVLGAIFGAGLGAVLGATVFAPSSSAQAARTGRDVTLFPAVWPDRVGAGVRVGW